MNDTISTNKFVELTYRIVDKSNGEVIEQVEDPLGYVQGVNTLLFNQVTKELEGKSVGDEVEILLKAEEAFGPKIKELIFENELIKIDNDYYYSNVIARASKTMSECRGLKADLKSTGTEG